MPLDPRTLALVRGSFQSLRPQGSVFMERFYERLFRQYPYTRVLFKAHEMGEQRLAFLGALTFLVAQCDRPETRQRLSELGALHDDKGVEPGHYAAVAESLLWAADEVMGEVWTPEVHSAWGTFVTWVVDGMLDRSLRG